MVNLFWQTLKRGNQFKLVIPLWWIYSGRHLLISVFFIMAGLEMYAWWFPSSLVIPLWWNYSGRHLLVPIHSSPCRFAYDEVRLPNCLTATWDGPVDCWADPSASSPVWNLCIWEGVLSGKSRHLCTWSPLGSMVALAAVDVQRKSVSTEFGSWSGPPA